VAELDGNPRALDGNGDCTARRDVGADEALAAPPTDCPKVSTPTGTGQRAAALKKCKKKKSKKARKKCLRKAKLLPL
jgi:hypothetical protein